MSRSFSGHDFSFKRSFCYTLIQKCFLKKNLFAANWALPSPDDLNNILISPGDQGQTLGISGSPGPKGQPGESGFKGKAAVLLSPTFHRLLKTEHWKEFWRPNLSSATSVQCRKIPTWHVSTQRQSTVSPSKPAYFFFKTHRLTG